MSRVVKGLAILTAALAVVTFLLRMADRRKAAAANVVTATSEPLAVIPESITVLREDVAKEKKVSRNFGVFQGIIDEAKRQVDILSLVGVGSREAADITTSRANQAQRLKRDIAAVSRNISKGTPTADARGNLIVANNQLITDTRALGIEAQKRINELLR